MKNVCFYFQWLNPNLPGKWLKSSEIEKKKDPVMPKYLLMKKNMAVVKVACKVNLKLVFAD